MRQGPVFKFRLYIAPDMIASREARANLAAICRQHLAGRHEIEVVNVYQEARRTLTDGILMTPTLIKLAPLPVHKIVGTLVRTELVLQVLGLEVEAA